MSCSRVLTIFALIMLVPFVIVTMNALKSPAEYAGDGPLSLPDGFYLQGLIDFWNRVDYGQKLLNSLLISGAVAVLAVIVSTLNAYALGIGRVKGRMWLLIVFLLANTLPHEALVYPLYYLSKEVGLYDSRLAIVLIFVVIQTRLRHLPALRGAVELPARGHRGGADRRRRPLAGAVAGRGAR